MRQKFYADAEKEEAMKRGVFWFLGLAALLGPILTHVLITKTRRPGGVYQTIYGKNE